MTSTDSQSTYPYTFCLADKSAVSQKMNVGDYLDALDPEDEIIDDKKAKTEQKDEKTAECNAEAGPEANKPKTFTRQKVNLLKGSILKLKLR